MPKHFALLPPRPIEKMGQAPGDASLESHNTWTEEVVLCRWPEVAKNVLA